MKLSLVDVSIVKNGEVKGTLNITDNRYDRDNIKGGMSTRVRDEDNSSQVEEIKGILGNLNLNQDYDSMMTSHGHGLNRIFRRCNFSPNLSIFINPSPSLSSVSVKFASIL